MADTTFGVHSAPAATTLTDAYTVPAVVGGSNILGGVISSLIICNRSAVQQTFRVTVAYGGGVDNVADYIYRDKIIAANDTIMRSPGIGVKPGDKVRVYASDAQLSFTVSGMLFGT